MGKIQKYVINNQLNQKIMLSDHALRCEFSFPSKIMFAWTNEWQKHAEIESTLINECLSSTVSDLSDDNLKCGLLIYAKL